jgi:hypothetical protein
MWSEPMRLIIDQASKPGDDFEILRKNEDRDADHIEDRGRSMTISSSST